MFWFVFWRFQMKLAHFRVFFFYPAGEIWNCNSKQTRTKFFQMLISSRLISPPLTLPLIVISRKARKMQALKFLRWINRVNYPRTRFASISMEIKCLKNDCFYTNDQTWRHEDLNETKNRSADQKMNELVNEPDILSACLSIHPPSYPA